LKVLFGQDGVLGRLLHDNAPVHQAFEINEAFSHEFLEAVEAGDLDDAQVFGFFQNVQGARLKLRRGHHLQVVLADDFRRGFVQRPVEHRGAPERRDAVRHVGLVVGLGRGVAPGGAAGVVVLQDDAGRFFVQKFDDIEAVVQVGEVGLAGVLARLEHAGFVQGAHQPQAGFDEPAGSQGEVAPHQLVEGRLLVGVFPVAQPAFDDLPAFGVGNLPGALAVHQLLVAEVMVISGGKWSARMVRYMALVVLMVGSPWGSELGAA
jgi:hypothetical protein